MQIIGSNLIQFLRDLSVQTNMGGVADTLGLIHEKFVNIGVNSE